LEKLSMKKTLIALAVLAASGASFAQSTVTLSGSLGLTFGNVEYAGAPSRMDVGRTSGAITLSGSEDLGGGLKANFVIQQGMYGWTTAGGAASTSLTGNTLGNFGDRQMFATLTGDFGTVKIGRDLSGGSTAPLGAGKVDGTRAITGMDDNTNDAVYIGNIRATSVSYVTPAFNGFNAYAGFTPQNYGGLTAPSTASTTVLAGSTGIGAIATVASSSTKADASTAFGLTYAAGPFAAALDISNLQETVSSLGNNATVTSIGAGYDLGVAKVGLVYQTAKGDGKANTYSNILSVSVPVGAMTLGAAYGKRSATTNGAFSAKETLHNQLSANYALSKRTNVYFAYSNKNVAGSTVDAKDAKETGVGIAHSF
jgi:hypothetical protein